MEAIAADKTQQRFDTTYSPPVPAQWLLPVRLFWGGILLSVLVIFTLAMSQRLRNLSGLSLLDYGIVPELGLSAEGIGIYYLVLDGMSFLVFVVVALALFVRSSPNWHMVLVSIMLATFGGININQSTYIILERGLTGAAFAGLLSNLGNISFILFLYTFPDGRFASRLSKGLALFGVIWFVLADLFPSFLTDRLSLPDLSLFVVPLILYSGSLFVQMHRLDKEKTPPAQWQQVKWITFGLIAALVAYISLGVEWLLPALQEQSVVASLYQLANRLFVMGALSLVPLTIGFSAVRYRLWELDFFINRGLVYGALTVGLLLATLLDIFIFQWLFRLLTGREQAPFALAVAALISGIFFQPVRRWLQRWVDQKVYGIQIDYQVRPSKAEEAAAIRPAQEASTIGPYQIVGHLGRGGMAEVYKGFHPTLNRAVAVKVMLADRAGEADFRIRFEREAQAIAVLRHPNIVDIFDFGQADGTYYMVMEYIDGSTLRDYIRQNGRLSLHEGRLLLEDVASALDYAHEQGLVHRDIKPSNVMLQQATTQSGRSGRQAILTDFGIAKMMGGPSGLTQTGMVGTLDYIAPEQIRNARDVDGRADVYALGVMAYEMLTGRLPFQGMNPAAMLIAHLQQPAPDAREQAPDLPEGAALALRRAMAKEAADRFPRAGAFVEALVG